MNNQNKLITREQTAAMLDLKPQTLAKWAHTKRGDLKMIKIGSAVRYRVADVEDFIEQNTTN